MATELSKRCDSIVQSEIRVMSVECEKACGINLSQGVCDMEAPAIVRKAAKRAIDGGINSYTRYDGIAELRRAIAAKMLAYNKIKADPETEVVVSSGSTGSFYSACLALLNPGDEVILFEPYYGYHVNTLLAVEAVPAYVRLKSPDWTFSAAELEAAITPRTKAIVVNTPANPSGKVFSKKELELIAGLAKKYDFFIFTDEIYEHILYDGAKHLSPGSIKSAAERTITISGLSKTFSITGWRIGYSVCNKKWSQMIGYMTDLVYVCAPSPLQAGVARGLTELGESYHAEMCADLLKKREMICSALSHAGLEPFKPRGAYYVLADSSRLGGVTGKERAMRLLEKTGIACVPGEAFFHNPQDGYGLLRFCYAKTQKDLEDACNRLERLKAAV
ncbi:MAG: pyridoxal phosphate-dependent aminotransferase [Elusimicrobiales bacterium]|nr:pyridoxal phosphate-dependent aminotransferase [Elusimicrobiales bacterium]